MLQKVRTYLKTQPARTFHLLENIVRVSRTPDDAAVSAAAAKEKLEFEAKVEAVQQARLQAEAEAEAEARNQAEENANSSQAIESSDANSSQAVESSDSSPEGTSSGQLELANGAKGGFLTEVPDDDATTGTLSLGLLRTTELQYHPPPLLREREIRVVIEAPPASSSEKNSADGRKSARVNVRCWAVVSQKAKSTSSASVSDR